MVDTTFLVKDAREDLLELAATTAGDGVLTPYHIEHADQRAALLAALDMVRTAIVDQSADTGTGDKLDAILTQLKTTLPVSIATQPLPVGAAKETSLVALIDAVLSPKVVGIEGTVPLPTGAATDMKLVEIVTALSKTLPVSLESVPLPTGAANLAKQIEILEALQQVFKVSVDTLPLPGGAATEAKLEEVRALLAAPTKADGAASDAKLDAVRVLLANGINVSVVNPATGGNIAVSTTANGDMAILFAPQACKQLTIVNNTGTTVEFLHGTTGVAIPIFDQSMFSIYGINNANEISVRRADRGATPVTVQARFES